MKARHLLIGFASLSLAFAVLAQENTAQKNSTEKAKTEDSKTKTTKTAAKKTDEEKPNPTVRLESVFVGDKEQPAISYFIPWQGIGTPDKLHWNVEEKHDQALNLVDREIMLRSIHFYEEMNLENPAKESQ